MTDGEVESDRTTTLVETPSAEAAADAVESALDRGRVVSIVGECAVDASGRKWLSTGDRHVLLKPDRSVVVHGSMGTAPDIELARADGFEVSAVDGALSVTVTRGAKEYRIRLTRVELLVTLAAAATEGTDGVAGTPDVEKTREGDGTGGAGEGVVEDAADRHGSLRERILAEPKLVEPGFRPLSTERTTSAGPIDVYGQDAEDRAVVVEIKTHRAGPAAVGQLDRYVRALARDLHGDTEIRGILVAPSATERTRRLLREREFTFRAIAPEGR